LQKFAFIVGENQYQSTNQPRVSLHFNRYFPGGPQLTGTRRSPFRILLELMLM